jgi:hypothetical protein
MFDDAMTPIAGYAFIGDVLAVDKGSASSQECGRSFGVTMMTLACLDSGGARRGVLVATQTDSVISCDASGDVVKAGCSLPGNAVAPNASDGGCRTSFTGCFEVTGETGVRVHVEMALGADSGMATGAAEIGATIERTQVIGMAEEISLANIQRLPQSFQRVAATA